MIDIQDETVVAEIVEEIHQVEAKVQAQQAEIESLKQKLGLAKGTGDVSVAAKAAVAAVSKPNLMARLEAALRERPMALEELVSAMGEPAGRVQATLKGARTTGKLHNIGAADRPVWFWRIGKGTSSQEVQKAVLALVRHQPMTFVELQAATRAEGSSVQNAIVAIRKSGIMVSNLGTTTRARYFVMPEGALDARLEPKTKK